MTIEEILRLAKEQNVSDIHMAPGNPLLFRVNGILMPQTDVRMKPKEVEEILSPVMTEEQTADLKRTGEMEFAFSVSEFSRVRVTVYRQRGTYAASLRILPYEVPVPEMLGIPASVAELMNCRQGLVLITGAAGSGKSTTLASLLEVIAERDCKNIITLEAPIEYLHSHKKSIVSQREVGCDIRSYADGIRAAMRQDADVIMIGELNDADTISMALAAAEAGHLVCSVLHAPSAADALTRMTEVFPVHHQQQVRVQLASVLNGVAAQQLLPRSDGAGRIAVFEVLLANETVRNLIREGKIHHISGVISGSRKEGMQRMDDAILDAYMRSEITMETAVSYAQDAGNMEKRVHIF